MKIKRLEIENFKAIKHAIFENLEEVVLIAGKNGIGKSSIFDSIRLIKSIYGNYHSNEIQNWYEEHQISNFTKIGKLLRDKNCPLLISMAIELSDFEKEYFLNEDISQNIKKYLRSIYQSQYRDIQSDSFIEENRKYGNLQEEIEAIQTQIKEQIQSNNFIEGFIELKDGKEPFYKENPLFEILFSIYEPNKKLGVFDYHGAHRIFNKESLSHLTIDYSNDSITNRKQFSLYNYSNKYNNIKAELASNYIKALILKENGIQKEAVKSLDNSLEELFEMFIPGKKYNGISPNIDGELEFSVKLSSGETHDIAELSSGEKEILFSYLKLRNSNIQNSIILIDEPELHLNPKLSKQLPEFYHKHLGKEHNNQIWLSTHSESMIQKSIGLEGFSIFHMIENPSNGTNQVSNITLKDSIEEVFIDLVGGLSEYQKGNKVVILEGKESEFDRNMITTLFPELNNSISFISAGSKTSVQNLQNILKKAADDGIINKTFYSITDKDSEKKHTDLKAQQYSWDVYHIENYLLSDIHILSVLRNLNLNSNSPSPTLEEIENNLKEIAKQIIPFHIEHLMNLFITDELGSYSQYKIENQNNLNEILFLKLQGYHASIYEKINTTLTLNNISQKRDELQKQFEEYLLSDEWRCKIRGRDILKQFSGMKCNGINYISFRNLIINKMKDDGYQPSNMKKILYMIKGN